MGIGDVIEFLIGEDWSRRWVRIRGLFLVLLVLVFPSLFAHLLTWYANWKGAGLVHQLQLPAASGGP